MKNNILGYIFFLFIIVIMVFAIYKVNSNKQEVEENSNSTSSVVTGEKGKEITLAVSKFDTINPIATTNKNVQDVTKLIYESLVNVTSDGKTEACLAKEWETADNLTYIIKLRTGVKWSDGTYFSSSDVKYTIDKLKSKEANKAVYAENVRHLKEVDIIDNTTLRIILSEKIPFYEYYLTFPILSSHYYGEDDFWESDKNSAPITTGRFQISEHPGNRLILTKNPYWWNKEKDDSVIEKVTINFYSSVAELYNAFKLGGVDLIATKNKDYKQYIGKIGYNTVEAEGRKFAFIAMNTQSEHLSDINVRKAIRSAINKEEIVSSIYQKSYTKANFPLSMNSYLVEDKNENYFDFGKMEEYLKNAGWIFRRSGWQKTVDYKTKKLELSLVVRKNSNRADVADYISKALADKGIYVYVIKAEDKEYNNYLKNKNYDMILAEMTNSISPDLTSYFGNGNLANFENNEFKEILQAINNITNQDELKSKYQRLYEIYNEEVPFIGIARSKVYVLTSTYLNGKIESRWYDLFFNFKDWYKS